MKKRVLWIGRGVRQVSLSVAFVTAIIGVATPSEVFALAGQRASLNQPGAIARERSFTEVVIGGQSFALGADSGTGGWAYVSNDDPAIRGTLAPEAFQDATTTVLRDDPDDYFAVLTIPTADGGRRVLSLTGSHDAASGAFEGFVTSDNGDSIESITIRHSGGGVVAQIWPVVIVLVLAGIVLTCVAGRVIRGGCDVKACASTCAESGGLRECKTNLCGECSVRCNNDPQSSQ